MKKNILHIIHPFLAAIFPIIFLYSQNMAELTFSEIVIPLLLNLLITAILLVLVNLIFKEIAKSAIIVTTIVFFFYSYGYLLNLVIYFNLSINDNYDLMTFPIFSIILILILILIIRSRRNLTGISNFLNIAFGLLVIFQIIRVGYFSLTNPSVEINKMSTDPTVNMPSILPDIYYIVLDGYARGDILKEIIGYDNSPFLDELRKRGFYIADSSHSNYGTTVSSVASALNLEYIHRLIEVDTALNDLNPMYGLLKNNRVFQYLKKFGYKTVAFESGFKFTQLDTADFYFSPEFSLSEFQNTLLNLTPVSFFNKVGKNQFDFHRERINFTLNKLGNLSEIKEPKVVFAHIISPHPPFVFNSDGTPNQRNRPFNFGDCDHFILNGGTTDEYIHGYREQCIYISKRILETIDSILINSSGPPIIIVQGDHGSGVGVIWSNAAETDVHERFSILNAYFLPRHGDTLLNRSITPINSFRVILNRYFGTNLEMLPNHQYFTYISRPYKFIDITDLLREMEGRAKSE